MWRYVHRAVDQHWQVIDVMVSKRRDAEAARRLFRRALTMLKVRPSEVVTDAAPVYPRVLDELIPTAWHDVEHYGNNRIEADDGGLKRRLQGRRGLRTTPPIRLSSPDWRSCRTYARGHDELAAEALRQGRVAAAFTERASAT